MKKLLAIMFSVLLVLSSCSMENNSRAVVSFDFDGGNSRGISVVDMDTAYYVVEGSGPSSFNSGRIGVDSAEASFEILPGSWSFMASAYNDEEQKIGESQSVSVTVNSGANAPIQLIVRELDGEGSVTFSIKYTNADAPDTALHIQADDGPRTVMAKEGNIHTLTLTLSNGFHEISIYEGDSTTPSEVVAVRVVTGYDTKVTMEYVASSFGDGYFEIDSDITQTPVTTLEPGIVATAIPMNIPFSVDSVIEGFSGAVNYQWFLNGVAVPDATSSKLYVESLNALEETMNAGTIEAGTPLSLVLKVTSGDLSWTSDAFLFAAAEEISFPTVSVAEEERVWTYNDEAKTVILNIQNLSADFSISFAVDGVEIQPEVSSLVINPADYTVGSHSVTYTIISEALGLTSEVSLFSFMVVPTVTLQIDNNTIASYEYLTGSVSVAPVGTYKVLVSVGEGLVYEDLTLNGSASVDFSFPLGAISEDGSYDVVATVSTLEYESLASSQPVSVNVNVPAITITTDSLKVYQGQSLEINSHENASVSGAYQWVINGEVLTGNEYNWNFHVSPLSWPIGEYTIQLKRGGEESNPLTIEVLESPDLELLVNGQRTGGEFSVGDEVTFSISNPDNVKLSEISWTLDGHEKPEYYGQEEVTIEITEETSYSMYVNLLANGVPFQLYRSVYVHDNGSDEQYFNTYLRVDKVIIDPEFGELNVDYGFDGYEDNIGYPVISAELELVKLSTEEEVVVESVAIESSAAEGSFTFNLKEAGTYDVRLICRTEGGECTYHYKVFCTSDSILPVEAQEVYQAIIFDDDADATADSNAAVGTGTLLIDTDESVFAYYYVEFTEDMLAAMTNPDESGSGVGNPMTIDGGSLEESGDTLILSSGSNDKTYVFTKTSEGYKDESGHVWKKLNTSTREIGDFTGSWSLAEIRPSAAFMNKAYEIGKGYLEKYVDADRPWGSIVSFDDEAGEGIGVNVGLEIRQDGNFNLSAAVDLDFSALNVEASENGAGKSVSLADDLELLGKMSGEISSYGKDDMLVIGGESYPIAIQKSTDGSVLIIYILAEMESGYEAMFAVPLTKNNTTPPASVPTEAFSEPMYFTMNGVMDLAIEAETGLGEAGSQLLYDLFAYGDNTSFSSLNNGIWDVDSIKADDEQSKAMIEDLFGSSIYALMGMLSADNGNSFYSDNSTINGRAYNFRCGDEDYSTRAYLNITLTPQEDADVVEAKVSIMYDNLPISYDGTVSLSRRADARFTELAKGSMFLSTPLDEMSFEFRTDGELWMTFPGQTAMHVCDYGLRDGMITVLSSADILPELNGLAFVFGGSLPYEEQADGVRINVLEDWNKQPIGMTLEASQG